MTLYRQGDVLVLAVDQLPADAQVVPRDGGRLVLAVGEATGHAHVITAPHATLLAPAGEGGDRFLRVEGAAVALVHPVHATIVLPPGGYLVRRQREYTPDAQRWVAD